MKDLSFLKERYYVYKGIYDNKNVYENTLEAIKVALRKNKAMYLTVCETKDKKLIVCEEDVLIRIQNQKDALNDMTNSKNIVSYKFTIDLSTIESESIL